MNDLQSITESQKHQNARVIVSEESANVRWGEQNLREVSKRIQYAYGRVVFWRKNLFMPPTSAAAETTKLMNGWMKNWPLNNIAFKAINIMPSLLLQNPSKHLKQKII